MREFRIICATHWSPDYIRSLPESYLRKFHLFITRIEPQTAIANKVHTTELALLQYNKDLKKKDRCTSKQLMPHLFEQTNKSVNLKKTEILNKALEDGLSTEEAFALAGLNTQ